MSTDRPAPRRIDPAALKALSHPLRVELLDRLAMFGPATASALGDALGETSGATSYHLRQLARHGLIEEDPERGTGRDKFWRVVPGGLHVDPESTSPGTAEREATHQVVRQIVDQRARHVDAFVRRADIELDAEWRDAAMIHGAALTVTASELGEISMEIEKVVREIVGRYADRDAPADARPVAVHVNAFPLLGDLPRGQR